MWGRGFQIQAPPSCRYGLGGILVDVMMTTSTAMGFSDPWYPEAFSSAEPMTLPNGLTVKVVRPAFFLATKLNAWRDRGEGDYYGSKDLEDILAVIDGRPALLDEVRQSSDAVKAFLAKEFAALLNVQTFLDAIPGHLGGDTIAHTRAEMAVGVMRQIVELGRE